jgi:hypothetical protein
MKASAHRAYAHKMSQYYDGSLWIEFCKVCGSEGADLHIPCCGKFVVDKKPPVKSIKRAIDKATEPN